MQNDEYNTNDEIIEEESNRTLDDANETNETPNDSEYKPVEGDNEENLRHLPGMYRTWFLEYASYVNLERAVPNLHDGFKPVQRRVLHAMRRMEDGRYNKVANIVGETMKFHPHGDASIYEALVVLGQKDFLIDCQGNWGNILTGDEAAAARYIEARLSKFALEVVFNNKTTEWKPSYDGRNQEPVWLPSKFPLLLVQGSEGIGLGLNTKILPHNFKEIADAAIAYLRNEPFQLYPDFVTGGLIDVSSYRDGARGGKVKIRAKIEKRDSHTLVITEIPYGLSVNTLCDSIIDANAKGKISIKRIDDNTAATAEIVLHLEAKNSPDKTIDALYAFTECEHNYSPNCCVVYDNKPQFITVSDLLRTSTDNTKMLLQKELNIEASELQEKMQYASLEKIFIEQRIYKDEAFEQAKSNEEAILHIEKRITPFTTNFVRPVTHDDIRRLLDIKMARILKFNVDDANRQYQEWAKRLEEISYHLAHLIEYTIAWYQHLKDTYGNKYPRHTELRNFENIVAAKVVANNAKLYVNKNEGYIGTALKKEEGVDYICDCSDIDDVIIFFRNGEYRVTKITEKSYVGKDIIHVGIFHKNDKRTVYNVVYRDGKEGAKDGEQLGYFYMKRFSVNSISRDKTYNLTQGNPGSRVFYFSANPNGEGEVIRIALKQTNKKLRNMTFEKDFATLAIKGRQSRGNLLTKYPVYRILLKHRGGSTLGGTPIWFDEDVARLNMDNRGRFLGEFFNNDLILIINNKGEFYTTNFDLTNHYDNNILRIEKFNPDKIWTAVLLDADEGGYPYLKRFPLVASNKPQSYIGENNKSQLLLLTDTPYPYLQFELGEEETEKANVQLDADEFISVKSHKAKGKRISKLTLTKVTELEPLRQPTPPEPQELTDNDTNEETPETDNGTDETGQLSLF
ncbi:MAG: DNA gyrase/topoisomerase IV subunit A [Bacteroidales bacterium]|nr:DNA gyrase/topoisomerase IV subunit A [Bacteroidales bacterium]